MMKMSPTVTMATQVSVNVPRTAPAMTAGFPAWLSELVEADPLTDVESATDDLY